MTKPGKMWFSFLTVSYAEYHKSLQLDFSQNNPWVCVSMIGECKSITDISLTLPTCERFSIAFYIIYGV